MSRLRKLHEDDHGVALVAALLAVIILSGVAVVLVSTSVAESRSTGNERDFENAMHVAEAGADEVIATVNVLEDHVTTGTAPCDAGIVLDLSTTDTEAEQRQWAIEQVTDCDLPALQSGDRGEAFGFRPVDTAGDPLDMIFGVSYVPSFDNPKRTRVVKLQYDRELFMPAHGIQTCGDLNIGGSATVEGDKGSVHANGDVAIDGNGYSIEKSLTATGSISGTTANAGSSETFAEEEFCPEIAANDFYVHSQDPQYRCYDNPGDSGCATSKPEAEPDGTSKPILWYDLCPDGHVRKAGTGASPCTGASVWTGPSGNYNGWKFGNGDWKSPNGIKTGIYYVYRSDVDDINGGGGSVSVFVEADPGDSGSTGNFGLRGNAKFAPALPTITFIADRDIQMNGSASGGGLELEGFAGAGEQVKLDGTATVNGSIYAQDQPHTINSPVAVSQISGNYKINFNQDLDVPMTGIIRVTAWNELRRN